MDTQKGTAEEKEKNLETIFKDIFLGSSGGGGDEEIIKTVEKHALQLEGEQIRVLMWLTWISDTMPEWKQPVNHFIEQYLMLKHHNYSAKLIIDAVSAISLKKFMGSNAFKVNIQK